MNIRDLRRLHGASDVWCEAGDEEDAKITESERKGDLLILRGESKHGRHVTVRSCDVSFMSDSDVFFCAEVCADEMAGIFKESSSFLRVKEKKELTAIALCIGNRNITCDAQGPFCAEILDPTYHLKSEAKDLYSLMGGYSLLVLSPGTLGQSGLDPSFFLSAAARKTSPDLIIVIDALAAESDEYIGKCVQISSAGITPGSGAKNARKRISASSTGVFTIGIGIPTVISAASLLCGVLERAGINEVDKEVETEIEKSSSLYLSPKNSDAVTRAAAKILSMTVRRFCEQISQNIK